jgi:hypothetical protein
LQRFAAQFEHDALVSGHLCFHSGSDETRRAGL